MGILEEIKFNFKGCETEADYSNALMQWITNRAFQFDKTKYNKVCLRLEDSVESCVAIEMCFIISAYTNLEFYVPRKDARKCRCYKKNPIIKAVSMRKWNKLSKELDTMCWDAQSTCGTYSYEDNGAMIYLGIGAESIRGIGVNLYGWNDNRKEYLANLKKAIKEAKKAIKEERKNFKEFKKGCDECASTDDKR